MRYFSGEVIPEGLYSWGVLLSGISARFQECYWDFSTLAEPELQCPSTLFKLLYLCSALKPMAAALWKIWVVFAMYMHTGLSQNLSFFGSAGTILFFLDSSYLYRNWGFARGRKSWDSYYKFPLCFSACCWKPQIS